MINVLLFIMNFLTKFAKYIIPAGASCYIALPERRMLDDVERARLNRYLPPVDKLTNNYIGFRQAIVSGSFALRLYTDRKFPVNDYDIYVDTDNYGTDSIKKDEQKIRNIYHDVDFDVQQFNYDDIQFINGIIETKSDGKNIQYIMVNTDHASRRPSLGKWHSKCVDIPVYIQYTNGVPYFHIRSRFEGFMAKYCGVLFQLHNNKRKEKYKSKGFWVL